MMTNPPIIDIDENLRLLGTAHVATASVEAVQTILLTFGSKRKQGRFIHRAMVSGKNQKSFTREMFLS